MDEREDYTDFYPAPRLLRLTPVCWMVMGVLSLGMVVLHYFVLPILLPGWVVD